MKLKVNNVSPGASYEGTTYDYWIDLEAGTGTILNVFDFRFLDVFKHLDKYIDVILLGDFIDRSEKLGQKVFGEIFMLNEGTFPINRFHDVSFSMDDKYLFKTDFGSILVPKSEIEKNGFKVGEKRILYFGRIDLLDYFKL